jgi:spermidine synthase
MTQTSVDVLAQLSGPPSAKTSFAPRIPPRFFAFFLISGFCSLLYEVVWLRLAMAQFGVTITMTSTVISVFMAGLGVGSWVAGRLTKRLEMSRQFPRLRAYALIEFLIGIGSLVVPYELLLGRHLLESAGLSSSFGYYAIAGLWLTVALLPWCVCMGATFPIAMWAIREYESQDRSRSFSFLYVANVLGAMCGALLPLLLIEVLGFRNTLRVGGLLNLLLAIWAFALSKQAWGQLSPREALSHTPVHVPSTEDSRLLLFLLFATGLTSMGMEVVWIRLFTPYLGTEVYGFAAILAGYLASTVLGSFWYRLKKFSAWRFSVFLWATLGFVAMLPLRTANPAFEIPFHEFGHPAQDILRTVLGITCFTVWLGFLTPMLVDRISGGDPDKAGRAYAVNVVGCIIGPLVAGFVLLPTVGERWSLGIFVGICFLAAGWFVFRQSEAAASKRFLPGFVYTLSVVLALIALVKTRSWESQFKDRIVLRDSTATVIATGQGMGKRLLINGVGITKLTPVTKFMAHMPLAFLTHPPERALDICFGMGTTYRSLLTWGIHADAAELVPSVPAVFYYFHSDAPQLLKSPLGRIIVDDGRRYLERTSESYDLITLDPPPPISAAGSSLLYSKEFYTTAKRKLRPGGILAQWLPGENPEVQSAVTKAMQQNFPYLRAFGPIEGHGVHLLASNDPIPPLSAQQLAQRLPASANADLVEWGPYATAEAQFAAVLQTEISPDSLIAKAPAIPVLSDDRPVNEYYVVRTKGRGLPKAHFR